MKKVDCTKDRVDVREVVEMHGVIPTEPGEPFDYHTHGLAKFGHPEFQVLAPGYCRNEMANLLWNHAERVVNAGERFAAGKVMIIDGIKLGYEVVPGDSDDDEPRLRIIDVPGACQCAACAAGSGKGELRQ